MNLHRSSPPALAILFALAGMPASAADTEDPDWPCEQALVSKISVAVVWDGPSVDGLQQRWGSDTEISALVQRLTSRGTNPTEYESLIEAYAAEQAPTERDRRLTLLFAGVLEVLDADRSKLNSGILRYSRDQQRRALALDEKLTELVQLESDTTDAGHRKLEELAKRIELEQRVFDDRERSIPFLCTRPRVVEQRIGELARAISGQLE